MGSLLNINIDLGGRTEGKNSIHTKVSGDS